MLIPVQRAIHQRTSSPRDFWNILEVTDRCIGSMNRQWGSGWACCSQARWVWTTVTIAMQIVGFWGEWARKNYNITALTLPKRRFCPGQESIRRLLKNLGRSGSPSYDSSECKNSSFQYAKSQKKLWQKAYVNSQRDPSLQALCMEYIAFACRNEVK